MRGRSLRLATADRVLAFMGYPPLGPLLRGEVEAYPGGERDQALDTGRRSCVGNPSFVGRLRRGISPHLATFDRVRAWMAANASEEELRAIGERLADLGDPFAGAGVEPEGDPRMSENVTKHLDTREAAAWLGLSPKTLERYRVSGEGPNFHRLTPGCATCSPTSRRGPRRGGCPRPRRDAPEGGSSGREAVFTRMREERGMEMQEMAQSQAHRP